MRKIFSLFFLVASVLFLNSELWGADWKVLYQKDKMGTYYYDTQSITHTAKNHVRVWTKMIYSEQGVREEISSMGEDYKNVAYEKGYFELDCTEHKMQILSGTYYSKDGKVISSHDKPDSDSNWSFISPDSIMSALYEKVCK
jgi:hypothetical protein